MVQFATPAAWLLASLLGVLIALYLWERSRRTVDVPSLLLWQAIPTATARAARFVPDPLFALQALVLLLLVAGLAGPLLSSRPDARAGERAVLVLDCSASMQALEGPVTRFELAQRALRDQIDALHPDDEVMLVAAGPQPAVALAPTRDHAEALRQLAALEPSDARANLDAALAAAHRGAARGDRRTRIALFTDTPVERLSPTWRDSVSVFPVGETDDNLSIDGIQIYQSRFDDPRTARAFVTVRNYASRESHGVLTVQLDGTPFGRHGFTLAARSAAGFAVPPLPGSGVLRASLDVDDALAVDNRAYAVVRPPRPIRLLAVSDDGTLSAELRRIAAAAPGLRLEVVTPTAYDGPHAADLVLFHRVAPPPPAAAASLYVAPADPQGAFPPVAQLQDVAIGDIALGHPALRDVRLDLPLPSAGVPLLDRPPWAETLVSARADGRDVPLVFAGEVDGQRRAVVAFDLAAQGLLRADHTDLLLLFLDLVDWLVPADDAVRIVSTGSVDVIDTLPDLPRRIVDPRGRERTLPATQVPLIATDLAGEYRISANGTEVRVFANLCDTEESDIRRPAARPHEVAPIAARAATLGRRPDATTAIGWGLYAMAATLLALEWLLARRRT
jgi:hypothetical protein